ncbi:MAG TPA: ribosome maturation factor [Saprospiraceae bacterium]|jgi:ribosome maturation factor RimP|nr:ribosome maturation factor [Saprospiraceae bacterium]HPI07423.1 ribosome maturation factor [Saprospiraceae bacterium]
MEITERIALILEEKYLTDEAYADCFTVEIELTAGQKLSVFADSDSGMTFEKCKKLSRYLESYIDTNNWLGEKYTLEVSSPGISRPLKFHRQYGKNVGRQLEVTQTDKNRMVGLLKAVADNHIVLSNMVVERDGKKKKTVEVETVIPFEQIEKAIVKLAF